MGGAMGGGGRGGGGGGMKSMGGKGWQSMTGHTVHMRGLPFRSTESDIIDVSTSGDDDLLLNVTTFVYMRSETRVRQVTPGRANVECDFFTCPNCQ